MSSLHACACASERLALSLQRRVRMAATVACVQVRTGFVREMCGDGGRACGRKAGGASPVLSVSRHALRSAASSCHRAVSIWNLFIALKMERPYVIVGAPTGRRCGTHDESMRRGKRVS